MQRIAVSLETSFKIPSFLQVSDERCKCGGIVVNGKCGKCAVQAAEESIVREREKRCAEIEAYEAGQRQGDG